jgi:hypothetical protein
VKIELIKYFLLFLLMIIFLACSNVKVLVTDSNTTNNLPPTSPSSIIILRSESPKWTYEEIGTITVNNTIKIDVIYNKMREEAAKRGADGVIGVNLGTDIKAGPVTYTSSSTSGETRTGTVWRNVVSYFSRGTLIHRKEK